MTANTIQNLSQDLSQELSQDSPKNLSLIHNSFTDLSDTEMAATTGGSQFPRLPTVDMDQVNKFVFLRRWEARFNAGNPNLPLVAQRLINGYYKGTNKPEYISRFAGWRNFAPQIFNFLPFTAGGTPAAINSAASFLSLF